MRQLDLPPVWLALAMAAMWALARFAPIVTFRIGPQAALGWALIGAAVAVAVWAAIWFRRRRTSIVPHRQPEALVTEGPFRYSRNPIYAADALILVGWGLILGAASAFLVIPVFTAIIARRFIAPEEARLAAAFPDDFARWKARVRRWI